MTMAGFDSELKFDDVHCESCYSPYSCKITGKCASKQMSAPKEPRRVAQNERKRQERERKLAAGLVRIEIWLTPDNAKNVRDYAEELRRNEAHL